MDKLGELSCTWSSSEIDQEICPGSDEKAHFLLHLPCDIIHVVISINIIIIILISIIEVILTI